MKPGRPSCPAGIAASSIAAAGAAGQPLPAGAGREPRGVSRTTRQPTPSAWRVGGDWQSRATGTGARVRGQQHSRPSSGRRIGVERAHPRSGASIAASTCDQPGAVIPGTCVIASSSDLPPGAGAEPRGWMNTGTRTAGRSATSRAGRGRAADTAAGSVLRRV